MGGSALGDALTEAGFGLTTRGAMALTETDETGGPSPETLQLDLRTVSGDQGAGP